MKELQAKWDWREFGRGSSNEPPRAEGAAFARPVRAPLELDGQSDNAFAILVLCREAALAAGWTLIQWDRFYWDATSGDHELLLEVVGRWFDCRSAGVGGNL